MLLTISRFCSAVGSDIIGLKYRLGSATLWHMSDREKLEMLSLFHTGQDDINALRQAAAYVFFPKEIVKANKVMHLASGVHFKDIYGINPNGKYSFMSMTHKEYGSYRFLAWCCVRWERSIPEKLKSLGLPFDVAYGIAKQIYNDKHRKP